MNIFSRFFKWLFFKKAEPTVSSSPTFGTSNYPPLPSPCFCYTVSGVGGEMGPSYEVRYLNCVGKEVITTVNPSQTLKFCAKSGTVVTFASYTYTKCTPECLTKIGPVDLN